MRNWSPALSCAAFVAALTISSTGLTQDDFIPPDPLNKLWEEYMLGGKPSSMGVFVDGANISTFERSGIRPLTNRGGWIETLYAEPYGINVAQRGEGFWGNGGWNVMGGVVSRVTDGTSVIQLYAKMVRHLHPHFPFNNDPLTDTGYEFFLLHRKEGLSGATVVRTWRFSPEEVASEDSRHGGREDHVRAFFTYDASTQTATVTIAGLKRAFEEKVDLSWVLQIESTKY